MEPGSDGDTEVVWGGDDGQVWAFHADGRRLDNFPRRVGATGANLRVALGNLDGQPGAEIVVTSNQLSVHALRFDGSQVTGWPYYVGAPPTSPVIMRLGSNPEPAVVFAADNGLWGLSRNGSRRFLSAMPAPNLQELAAGVPRHASGEPCQ